MTTNRDKSRPDVEATLPSDGSRPGPESVRRFRLLVVEGPEQGRTLESESDRCSVGTHASNDLVLTDATVSRFHCEVRIEHGRPVLRDLESRNGTVVDGLGVLAAILRAGSRIQVGGTVIRFELADSFNRLPVSGQESFGSLVGRSLAMRSTFALLEKVAPTEVCVLLEGETGTGKEEAAQSIHSASKRSGKPFVVVDCGSIPANLIESELFGHERGAFTGANERRKGAFEEANGGTIFLDEIGELPLDLQPKLLRVLERKQIKRVGAASYQDVDVRIIAATHRDLRVEVSKERFREDLYFRLAVVRIQMPPLRERPEDLPLLAERLLSSLDGTALLASPGFVSNLKRYAWPGNVRELRNHLERCLVFGEEVPPADPPPAGTPSGTGPRADASVSYDEARRRSVESFERDYVTALLERHDGKVAQAARAAGMDRAYLWRLIKRHGISTRD